MLHIPYWFRVLPAPAKSPSASILLIDDDGSNAGLGADYRSYYTRALEALGYKYDVFETYAAGACTSPWDLARQYKTTILFTGDSGSFIKACDYGISPPNLTGMNTYLANGGHLLVTGQDWGQSLDSASRDDDLNNYFGAHFVQISVFGATPLSPSAGAAGDNLFLKGVQVDLSANGDGAHNQNSVDALEVATASSWDAAPLFQAVAPDGRPLGIVGTRMSSEPTLERVKSEPRNVWTPVSYRTVYLSFGLEGVNDTTGTTTRAALLQKLLNWLDDKVRVTHLSAPRWVSGVNQPVKLTATAASSLKNTPIVYYRWDWGDSTVPVSTTAATAAHTYAQPGRYEARVEVMDAYGHKVVSAPVKFTVR